MTRNELERQISHTVPAHYLAAAAALALNRRTGATYATREELAAFIASLNTRELNRLRRLALSLIDQGTTAAH